MRPERGNIVAIWICNEGYEASLERDKTYDVLPMKRQNAMAIYAS
jgi:hypothetical protein